MDFNEITELQFFAATIATYLIIGLTVAYGGMSIDNQEWKIKTSKQFWENVFGWPFLLFGLIVFVIFITSKFLSEVFKWVGLSIFEVFEKMKP